MSIDNYAKDGSEELLPRSIAFFNRIPIESLRIRNENAMHLSKKFLVAIFSVMVCSLNVSGPSFSRRQPYEGRKIIR